MHKSNAVIVWIADIHFAIAPALIGRFEIDRDTFFSEFFKKLIDIPHHQKDHTSGNAITRERRNVQPNVITRDEKAGVQFGECVRVTKTGFESLHAFPAGQLRAGQTVR